MLTPGLGESQLAVFAGVFLLVLPALVYALLCTMWVLTHRPDARSASRARVARSTAIGRSGSSSQSTPMAAVRVVVRLSA